MSGKSRPTGESAGRDDPAIYEHLLDVIEGIGNSPDKLPTRADVSLEFERWEYARRCERAAAAMRELAIDAVALSQPANVRYFTGLETWLWKPLIPTVAILTADADATTILASTMDAEGVNATTWPAAPRFYEARTSPAEAIAAALADLGLGRGRVGFELAKEQLSYLSASMLGDIERALPDAQIVDAVPIAAVVRMLKSDAEVERLREAARLTEQGFAEAFDAARDGVTEADLARVAASAMILSGSLPAFAPMTLICRAGPPSYAQLLGSPGAEPVRPNQQIFLDGGCEYRGYQTDIMRSAVIGTLGEAEEEHFARLDEAVAVAIAQLQPGKPLAEARRAVADFALSRGLASDEEVYGIGHGIGLDRWELPLIADRPPYGGIKAREGMVLCVEPSIGLPPSATKRSGLFLMEDEVLVTRDGAEVISNVSSRVLRHLAAVG
jgi:Xaa-Pro aminopeptidase